MMFENCIPERREKSRVDVRNIADHERNVLHYRREFFVFQTHETAVFLVLQARDGCFSGQDFTRLALCQTKGGAWKQVIAAVSLVSKWMRSEKEEEGGAAKVRKTRNGIRRIGSTWPQCRIWQSDSWVMHELQSRENKELG